MRSRPVLFLAILTVGLTVPLSARDSSAAAPGRAGLLGAANMQLFGSYGPGLGDEDRWGYGAALRWRLSDRFALGADASRLSDGDRSIAPFGAGIVLGPGSRRALRPWVEVGAAYVLLRQLGSIPRFALGSTGNPGDAFGYSPRLGPRSQDAWGPYFGAGLEWAASERLGVFGGVRAYTWTNDGSLRAGPWDSAVAIRSGLSFNF